ncbi:agmatinase [Thalassospira sp.]|uniref:agmatinase n=1 Tax=Thalassospira sp. TaxID=1912094 RepID=UPI0025EC861B|nr:agmatinase [Thalassospira sp.]|tara:strand:+ start:630 stop:1646 length:1017 start_codon:yes stop_codon:yes gene_type:complete
MSNATDKPDTASGISFVPPSAMTLPRYAGVASFMRAPHLSISNPACAAVDIALLGVPWDGGTTNRPGARHGPRQLRDLSTMIRPKHPVTGQNPFEDRNIADLGDAPVNPADIMDTLESVTGFIAKLKEMGISPLSAGGDHLLSYPIIKALASDGPIGMVHFDAHTDLFDSYFNGFKYTHGTPFRRAIEEGYLDPHRVVQIGIRGTMYDGEDVEWGLEQGVRIIRMEEVLERGLDQVMAEARDIVGRDKTYVSFDIDAVDPAFAPGTGTPEIGGFSSREAQKMIRSLGGLNLVGADLVEVSPPFDPSGGTAWLGISLMYELLCVLAGSKATSNPNRKSG